MPRRTTTQKIVTLSVKEFVKQVYVDPSRNIRETYNVEDLAEEIITACEVWEPLDIYHSVPEDGTKCRYTLGPDGNRRARAIHMLHEQGRATELKPIPLKLLPKKPSEAEYLLRQLRTGNTSGKLALNAIEEGKGYKKMNEMGRSNAEIGRKVGKTEQYVKGRIQLGESLPELHKLLPHLGVKITETLARTYNKNIGDFSHKALSYLCKQITPRKGKRIKDEALELCREITGERGRDVKRQAVTMVAQAALKKAPIIGIGSRSQGPKTNAARSRHRQANGVEADTTDPSSGSVESNTAVTPEELMAQGNQQLQAKLADELLESIMKLTPDRFEQLVVNLLEKMGYGKGKVVGRSGDGGIDGIINQDELGFEKVYMQAKRWSNQVGEPEIRNFSGSLDAKSAGKGMFITTSTFSSTAERTAQKISTGNKLILLIDGRELTARMIRHGVGVVTEATYEVKRIDDIYFAEDV